MSARRGPAIALVVIMLLAIAAPPVAAYDPVAATERVSIDSNEAQHPQASGGGVNSTDISYDGRVAVFDTYAGFDPADVDGQPDAYVRDRLAGTTTLVDITGGGSPGNSFSFNPAINADGSQVAFVSYSNDLVAGDTNGQGDVFVRDLTAGSTVRVSVASDGSQGFWGGTDPSLSADGRFVAFSSSSSLAPSDTNNDVDTYVHDRDADSDGVFDEAGATATIHVSVASNGTGSNAHTYGRISPNGRFVALGGTATNLVVPDDPLCEQQAPDPDNPPFGTITVFVNCSDIFLHDRDADEDGILDEPGAISTIRVSQTAGGTQADDESGDPDVSDDGDVAFWSYSTVWGATTTASAFVREFDTGAVEMIGTAQSNGVSISASGRHVTFDSSVTYPGISDNNNYFDSYVYDRFAGTYARASVNASGGEVAFGGLDPVISGDGRHVLFLAFTDNLVPGDTNGAYDLFVRDLLGAPSGTTTAPGDTLIVPTDPISGQSPVSLTFDAITGAGTTNLTTSTDGPQPISGFSLGDPPTYYDISTSATFTGPVQVCISYAGVTFPDESTLALFHFDLALYQWVDITTSVDPTNDVICGATSSFSPFAIFAGEARYDFNGFFSPVDNAPTLNVLKAGAAVPIRFSLGGDFGLDVLDGTPSVQNVSCGTGSGTDAVEQTVSATASGLTYHPGSQTYSYVWKTSKLWANTCRLVVLTFNDGTVEDALFKFTK